MKAASESVTKASNSSDNRNNHNSNISDNYDIVDNFVDNNDKNYHT